MSFLIHPARTLLALLILILSLPSHAQMESWEISAQPQSIGLVGKGLYGKVLTESDVRSMDVVCKHVLAHFILVGFEGGSAFPQTSPLLERPEFAMVRGVSFMHHYCDAKVEKFRFTTASSGDVRARSLRNWGKGIQYCINAADDHYRDWPYRHMLYTEMAEYSYHDLKTNQAINFALKALELNDKYVPAYAVAADAYSRIKKKDEAIKILTQGLEKTTNNKPLVNRYKRLTGSSPKIKPMTDTVQEPAQSNPPPSQVQQETPQAQQAVVPAQEANKVESTQPPPLEPISPTPAPASKQDTDTLNKPPNRACRFCPDL